jgi:CRP-like cAMP-binding protein
VFVAAVVGAPYRAAMKAVEDTIAKVPLFAKLSGRDRKNLAGSFRERTFPAGTVITQSGQGGVGFFIIESGTATVSSGGQVRAKLGPSDYFGEIALLDGGTRTAEVVADTELHCYFLTSWEFRPLVQSHPDIAWSLLQSMAQRLREAEARLEG